MILRKNGTEGIVMQRIEPQVICKNRGQKATIDLSPEDPLPDLIIVAVQNLHGDLGVMLLEMTDDPGDPHGGHTGEAPNPQLSLNITADVKCRLTKLGFLIDHFLNIGDQPCPVIRKDHTPFAPGKELDAKFLFQPRHHLTDGGLGIAQRLRGGAEAPRLAHL